MFSRLTRSLVITLFFFLSSIDVLAQPDSDARKEWDRIENIDTAGFRHVHSGFGTMAYTNNMIFDPEPIDFNRTIFYEGVEYRDRFNTGRSVTNCIFKWNAEFLGDIIDSTRNASIINNLFEGSVVVNGVFNKLTSRLNVFSSDVKASWFEAKETNFNNSKVIGEADFAFCIWSETYMYDVLFSNKVSFFETEFSDYLHFYNIEFDGEVIFDYSDFPDTVTFVNVKTSKEIDLTAIKRSSKAKTEKIAINLIGSDADKFIIDYNIMRVYESEEPDRIEFYDVSKVYDLMLSGFRSRGYDTKDLQIDYKRFKYLKDPTHSTFEYYWFKIINLLDEWWWNYGFDKHLVPLRTLLLLSIFTVINIIFRKKVIDVYGIKVITDHVRGKLSVSEVFLMLFYTGLVFFGLKLTIDNMNFKGKILGASYIFFQYIVGLICIAYLIDFVIGSPQGG